jgi:hypothetical protein
MRRCGALQALVSCSEDPLDPATQAGTDRESLKEQARQAMLRASEGEIESTDAEVEDDETDEVVSPDADADEQVDDGADEDADEADEADPDDDEADAGATDDGDGADGAEGEPKDGKKNRRKAGKVARLYEKIERLESQLSEREAGISAEVERILAEKAKADDELARVRAEQEEDGKRIKQVRDYVHQLRGTDRELDALTREIASTEDLDPLALSEDQRKALKAKKARLNQILSARDVVDLATEYADADLKDRVSGILAEFARALPGVDRDFHQKLNFGPAIQHVYDAGLAQGKGELEKRAAAYEKRIADLEGKLLAAKAQKRPPLGRVAEGGAPVPSREPARPKPTDQMTPMERLAAMGAIDPKTGRPDPEFRRKLRLGQVSLAG